jgi:hypothetical protein
MRADERGPPVNDIERGRVLSHDTQHLRAGLGPPGQWPSEGKERREGGRLSGGAPLLGSSSTPSRTHGWPCPPAGKLSPRHVSCGHRDRVTGQHGCDEWMKKGGERREYWAHRG